MSRRLQTARRTGRAGGVTGIARLLDYLDTVWPTDGNELDASILAAAVYSILVSWSGREDG